MIKVVAGNNKNQMIAGNNKNCGVAGDNKNPLEVLI